MSRQELGSEEVVCWGQALCGLFKRGGKTILRFVTVLLFLLFICYEGVPQDLKDKWETLSNAFNTALDYHEETVVLLQDELEKLKIENSSVAVLLIDLQMTNDTLRTFNTQIGERMQDRDEELAQIYDDYDRMKHNYNSVRIWLASVCGLVMLYIAFRIARMFLI